MGDLVINLKNMKRGFSLIALIAVIAVLAIGGGVYFSSQNNSEETNTENTGNSSEENEEAKGTFRSLMSLGKSYMCSVKTMMGGVSSEGVVYIDTEKRMRGDFTSVVNGQPMISSMIRSGDLMYSWSGAQGVKMIIKENESSDTEGTGPSGQSVDLDQEVEYKCEDWDKNDSVFMPPSNVNFFELGAGIPGMPKP